MCFKNGCIASILRCTDPADGRGGASRSTHPGQPARPKDVSLVRR
ncbi:MAG: hypothetical protein AVDCRST_MAG18-4778 [uncultured Thermomicrobiales bacterium]|uniref:Uncharacterized protein n=1 Tax=uncultured Thermomicrobiales bacterium TaxID=1645740 RepID=A0A6J4VVS4_9BACT|nr:MAG: hypothetical protein AVDCRST_MAG18-4778 [uncultured Thermomicrobiales bacterium]